MLGNMFAYKAASTETQVYRLENDDGWATVL